MDSRRRRCRRRTLLHIRALAAAMREEAPREQQDRRAYTSGEYMAGCAGFIGMPGKLAGPRIGTKARHGGKQVFETPRLAIRVA
jgi:hypothetical protein